MITDLVERKAVLEAMRLDSTVTEAQIKRIKNLPAVEQPYSRMSFIKWLAIAFIVLRLCHVIEWSWAWVLSPIWVEFILRLAHDLLKSEA